jgi:hypothetical protein
MSGYRLEFTPYPKRGWYDGLGDFFEVVRIERRE